MSEARDPAGAASASHPGGSAAYGGSSHESPQDAALRLRAIFDHAFQFMGLLSPSGVVLEVNRAALEFGGLSADEVVGRNFWETGWWESAPEEQARLQGAVRSAAHGEFVRYEVELAAGADGVQHMLDFSLKPVYDHAGAVSFLIAEARDITETKWAERALRVSEARFAGMISIASDAIVSIDENFTITLFNRGAEAIFGYAAAEVLGRPLDILLPERARGVHAQHLRHFAASPVAARRMGERQEIAGRRKDGTEFPAEASISRLDLFGSAVFTVVLRDITERKRVERSQRFLAQAGAILASSLEYEKTLASVAGLTVPDLADWSVIYVRDGDGTLRRLEVAHADPSKQHLVSALLGYPLDPRTPHPAFAVMDTGAPELVGEVSEELIRAISHSDEQYRIYTQLGMASLLVVPLVAHGVTRGAMGFFSATPRRYGAEELALAQELALVSALAVDNARLYRDAQRAVQAREDMIAVVSHDLGNPLSAIRIGTSLLMRSLPPPEGEDDRGRRHLEFIRQSAQQMENLVNDLLDMKRLEAGTLAVQPDELESGEVVSDVLQVFRPIADNRGIALESRCEQTLPAIYGDYRRLVQVLSNLVGNAIKFTDAGGAVRVSASAAREVVVFSVSDTGCGIAPDNLPHVFDRFWQGRRDGRVGLGLGLAIARGVVEAHGGRIWVESSPGEGSTFLFTMPTAKAARQR
jgi:PAS domain S-box-containing protein